MCDEQEGYGYKRGSGKFSQRRALNCGHGGHSGDKQRDFKKLEK